jgi:GT2 family glycosyltransferase
MKDDLLQAHDDLAFLERVYIEILGRPADPQGLSAYLHRLRGGTPRSVVLAELQQSSEALAQAARQAGHSHAPKTVAGLIALGADGEFVRAAFELLLGRAPANDESLHACQQLAAGADRRDMLRDWRRLPEATRRICGLLDPYQLDLAPALLADPAACTLDDLLAMPPESFVHMAYQALLGREPDPSGRLTYLARLQQGGDRVHILADMQGSEEARQRGVDIPGLRQAASASRSWQRRFARLLSKLTGTGHSLHATTSSPDIDAAHERKADVVSTLAAPVQPDAAPQRSGLIARAKPSTSLAKITAYRAHAIQSPSALDRSLTEPVLHGLNSMSNPDSTSAGPIVLERFVGPYAIGWSRTGGACSVSFGGRLLGSIAAKRSRPDVQAAQGLDHAKLGFEALLGGLLQFGALKPACMEIELAPVENPAAAVRCPLHAELPEALAFSPLKSFGRLPPTESIGKLLSIDFKEADRLALLVETSAPATPRVVQLDAYQAMPGEQDLERLARYSLELKGQYVSLEFPLIDRAAPVLLVVTDAQHRILATDCLPLPEMHADSQRALIDFHSMLTGGQAALDVAAKIGRSHLDAAIRCAIDQAPVSGPCAARTAVLLYSRENHDFMGSPELDPLQHLGSSLATLRPDGQVSSRGVVQTLSAFLDASDVDHVLLADVRTSLRPDFWAVVAANAFRIPPDTQLVHWHSIWLEGTSRPYVAKAGLLLDAAFVGHRTIPLRAALISVAALRALQASPAVPLKSGALLLEQALAALDPFRVACIPIPMETVEWPATPVAISKSESTDHVPLPTLSAQPSAAKSGGVSVIINFRNSPEDTIACLRSLRAQSLPIALEVVLVNNLSSPENAESIKRTALELFTPEGVQFLDYPHEFNHSAQCNVAAKCARHELLFMLSNDSVLLTEDALARACAVAEVPWVGTAGFRIVGNAASKSKLQSLGLGLSPRQMLFHGGSPLATYRPGPFLLPYTQETLGNTFAAVVVRRDTYLAMGGLDEDAFPTNYNDVDFCCRALQQGLRHITIGSAIVQHVGRGSREMDLDLPIDQRILGRCPDFSRLLSVGVAQL